MKILRFRRREGEPPLWGWLSGDRIGEIKGSPFGEFRRREARYPLDSVTLLAPVKPGKIICVGRNYAAHAAEHDSEVPEIPLLFAKASSSVLAPGKSIILPPQSQRVEHEAANGGPVAGARETVGKPPVLQRIRRRPPPRLDVAEHVDRRREPRAGGHGGATSAPAPVALRASAVPSPACGGGLGRGPLSLPYGTALVACAAYANNALQGLL